MERNNQSAYKIFTGGSGNDGRAGASVVLYERGHVQEAISLRFHLGKLTEHTTYKAESVGAILAMWLLRSIPNPAHSTISLYADRQLNAIDPALFLQHMILVITDTELRPSSTFHKVPIFEL